MPLALMLAAALAASPPSPPPRVTFAGGAPLACGAQVDPKFVTYVPPAEAKGSDPLFRLVNAEQDSRLAGVPADALGCLQRLQRARSPRSH